MSEVVSKYVQELRPYTRDNLKDKFSLKDSGVDTLVENLKKYKILKVIKKDKLKDINELMEIELEEKSIRELGLEKEDNIYVFKFVGVVAISNIVIKSLPKYIKNECNEISIMKQVLDVLRKYSSQEQTLNNIDESEEENGRLLSLMIEILKEFNESGIYFNYKDIQEINGEGEILWNNTIESKVAILNEDRPYYLELDTNNTIIDNNGYISRLHAFIITEISKKLKNLELLEVFDLMEMDISNEEFYDFGEYEYITDMINKELNNQFVTSKQKILKLILAYIEEKFSGKDDTISIYGSTSFNLVWEDVCAKVFNDVKNSKLCDLNLIDKEIEKDRLNKKLIEIIDKPGWIASEKDKEYKHKARQTLKPDLLSIYGSQEKKCFGIFDAKYYNLELTKEVLKGNPGVGDVIKQYLYQLAYKDFIEKNKFNIIKNAFFMPNEGENYILLGRVEMDMFHGLGNGNLEDILVVKLPSYKMFDYYIKDKKIKIEENLKFLNE